LSCSTRRSGGSKVKIEIQIQIVSFYGHDNPPAFAARISRWPDTCLGSMLATVEHAYVCTTHLQCTIGQVLLARIDLAWRIIFWGLAGPILLIG
jgi:hypothetical protein